MVDISKLIREYRRMKNEIERLNRVLYGSSSFIRSYGVARYGIEATLPRGSSLRSIAELEAMDLREQKQIERLERYERYVYALELAFDILEDETQKIIYDCLLDGMTYRQIAAHLSVSKDYVHKHKKDIVRQIRQNRQITHILQNEKTA